MIKWLRRKLLNGRDADQTLSLELNDPLPDDLHSRMREAYNLLLSDYESGRRELASLRGNSEN